MRRMMSVFVAIGLAGCSSKPSAPLPVMAPAVPLPIMAIDQAFEHDFGTTKKESETYTWKVANKGKADLVIWLKQSPGCGCTVPSIKQDKPMVIQPGKSDEISMTWTVQQPKPIHQ